MSNNPFMPYPVTIEEVTVATSDKALRTYKLVFKNKDDEKAFQYRPGQFAELSVTGKGEIPIGIASSPTEEGHLLFTINRIGLVTNHLHNMKNGDIMGVRGPLGNWYPLEEMKGKNLVIVGGGYAFTTLRSTIVYLLDPANRGDFGNIDVVYGAREPGLLLYREELEEWNKRDDINIHLTIDREHPDWSGLTGFVPTICEQVVPPAENTYAIICGPPIMIRFTYPVFEKAGYPPDRVIQSLENRMKCGFGMCGRCNIGDKYVCKDGPVFTTEQLNNMPKEY
jgi:sulfhydrogenase subunit gamma (sulfur reductase)